MKKKNFIGAGIAVVLILLIVAAVLIFKAPPMLSQPREEVVSVTITTNPWVANLSEEERGELSSVESQTTELLQKADMATTHYILAESTKRRKIGAQNDQFQHDPAYEVVFTYADGTSDRIFAAGDTEYILRCLNPEAPQEKRAYVSAYCPDLAPYIAMFAN